MCKGIEVCDRRLIPYPHTFLPGVFKPGVIAFTFCTERIAAFKIFQKAVKSPIRRKRRSNIKTAVMCDEKIVVEIIDKVGKHGENFALHDNERTEHCMIGKTSSSGFREFRNRG